MGRALSWSRHAALARSTAAPTTAHGDGLRRPQAPPVSSTPEVEEYLEGPWQPWWAPAHDVVRNWMGSSTWECAGTPVSRFWSHHLAAIGACTFIAIASVSAASSWVSGWDPLTKSAASPLPSARPADTLGQHAVTGNVCRVSRASPVQTAVRNCTRDEGRPFEAGDQVLASSHRKLLSSKAMVVSVAETPGQYPGRQG